ncbi:cupin domain-containing protein [Dyella tabacisoli]
MSGLSPLHVWENVMQFRKFVYCSAGALLATLTGTALAAEGVATAPIAVAKNLSDQKFDAIPGTPACMTGTGLAGDPSKGPALFELKFKTGCTVPWHWHTPDEHVMLVSGIGRMEMKDTKPVTLHAGGYAMLPSQHAHQFTCLSACVMFLRSDGVFDTHYINADGKEITPEEAFAKKK